MMLIFQVVIIIMQVLCTLSMQQRIYAQSKQHLWRVHL